MDYIKKLFNKRIYINIIDAIALVGFSTVLKLLKLLRVEFNYIYAIIVFLVVWTIAKIVFSRQAIKKQK